MAKKLVIDSGRETMTIEPLNMFRCVHVSLKDNNLNEWNDFMWDTQNMQDIIDFLTLQLKRSKRTGRKCNQRHNNH